jgi:hypothetical protein
MDALPTHSLQWFHRPLQCLGFLHRHFTSQLFNDDACINQDIFHWLIIVLPASTAFISSSVHTWFLQIISKDNF